MRMTRRRMGALAAIAMVAALIVAACGGGGATATPLPQPTPTPAPVATPTPRPTVAPTATPAPLPKRGGILKTRIRQNPQPWNILENPITSSFPLFEPVLSSLIQFDVEQQKITGDLAQSWEFSGDGKTITFKLRPGVKWHDGAALKASDVKFNLDATFFETLGFKSHLKGFFTAAGSVAAPDDLTVVINLARPSNSFFTNLTHGMMLNYAPQVSQNELKQGKVVGTNAFKWTKFDRDSKIEQRRNEQYFVLGADGKPLPYFDGIDWFMIADTTAHIAAFRTGQIDAFDHIDASALPGQLENIQSSIPNVVIGQDVGSWRVILVKNRPPFNALPIRKALQYGINRQEFVTVALKGAAVPAGFVSQPTDSGGRWGHSFREQEAFPGISAANKSKDIQEAERLLSSVGFTESNPLKVTMTVVSGGTFADEAIVAANLLNRVKGLKIDVRAEESAVHSRRLLVPGGDFDLIYRPFAQALDDPVQTIGTFWTTTAPRNFGEWSDATVDRLFDEQEVTPNEANRRALIRQAEERLYDQAYNIVIAWAATPWVKRPEMRGLFLGGAFSNRGRYDKAWLDR